MKHNKLLLFRNPRDLALLVLSTFFFCNPTALLAQKIATWKGGTPGRSTQWDCPTNWKEGRVPDEFSTVFIPDVSTSTFAYPRIETDVEVFALFCAGSARITILGNARLEVFLPPSFEPAILNDGRNPIHNLCRFVVLPPK